MEFMYGKLMNTNCLEIVTRVVNFSFSIILVEKEEL